MPTLDRLIVRQFRHVLPETKLSFDPRRNVILGQNGTGKTTLLKLVSAVVRNDLAELASEEFDLEWAMTFSVGSFNVRARNVREDRELPSVRPRARSPHRANIGQSFTFSYDLDLKTKDGAPLLEVAWADTPSVRVLGKERDVHRRAASYDLTEALWLMLDPHDGHASELRETFIRFYSESTHLRWAHRFDEGLEVYHRITAPITAERRPRVKSPMIQVTRGKGRTTAFDYELLPQALFEYFFDRLLGSRQQNDELLAADMIFKKADFGFLAQACDILEFADCELIFSLIERDAEPEGERLTFGNPKFRFRKVDGSIIPDAFLSYGQKRLLAFVYYLDVSRDITIADELVNGFHYRWISRCLDLCGDRQVFLTSQNPLLLDSLSFDKVESAQHTFITCRATQAVGEFERVVWANIDRRSATAFVQALDVQFQSVSEVLRSLDLW